MYEVDNIVPFLPSSFPHRFADHSSKETSYGARRLLHCCSSRTPPLCLVCRRLRCVECRHCCSAGRDILLHTSVFVGAGTRHVFLPLARTGRIFVIVIVIIIVIVFVFAIVFVIVIVLVLVARAMKYWGSC